jgi:hypothetical protein
MKKVIMLMSFVFAVFMSHAADNEKSTQKDAIDQYFKSIVAVDQKMNNQELNALCTVTLKGTVHGGVFSIEVSCTNTAETCELATKLSTTCLSAAAKTVKEIIF